MKKINKNAIATAYSMGFGNAFPFLTYAFVFYCGAEFHKHYNLSVEDMLISLFAIM